MPFCSADATIQGNLLGNKPGLEGGSGWEWQEKIYWVIAITIWGGLGSTLDSALGGWFQASVVDSRTGKVVEGVGGKKVSPFYLFPFSSWRLDVCLTGYR